ncbi:hypothetical protein MtrunA17_Chr8g0344231 [Medicago truncatula]|uniref:Uncharacterized protein n=1 Tax=Medicago truncatula TaxID=3880 RepID=A0A396GGB3_MEDTR|nr:hypothetical protein MtrunA17_Chr8g0344231 [Medicago truncatula]
MSGGRGCRSSSAPTPPFGVVLLSFQPESSLSEVVTAVAYFLKRRRCFWW